MLKSKGVRTIAPEEAQQLMSTGEWVLLDVRCARACGSGCVWMHTVFTMPLHGIGLCWWSQGVGKGGRASLARLCHMGSRMGTDQTSTATLARDFCAVLS